MICWTDLCKWEGRGCGCSERKNFQAQSEFFKALVAVMCQKYGNGTKRTIDETAKIMQQIERRVEAGNLFGGGGREEGA